MKMLLIALALVSGSAFAQEMDATEALTSIIPQGTYFGKLGQERCKVTFKSNPKGILVTASNSKLTVKRQIEFGTKYEMFGTTQFHSSESIATNDGFNENLLVTRADYRHKQYVTVADRVVTHRQVFEHRVECIINLKRFSF